VDEFADGDGLGGETDDLVEFTDRLPGGDGAYRQLMSGGDVRERGEAQAVEGLACSNRLECDDDVVRASEFECERDQLSYCLQTDSLREG